MKEPSLSSECLNLRGISGGESIKVFHGKVVAGLGEGQRYIAKEGYSSQFQSKLGFIPFPGTLNIRLDEQFIPPDEAIKIAGFSDEGKTFGGCDCYWVRINGVKAVIVRPERSSYPSDLIEIIAPIGLRKTLNLSDGDEVEILLD